MKLTLFILKKYLRFDKTQPFISITSILAFIGVCVGVMVLLVSMGIMNGMSEEFKKKIFTMNYPLTIYSPQTGDINASLESKLAKKFPNLYFSPYIQTQAVIKVGRDVKTVLMYGIDPKKEVHVNEVVKEAVKDSTFNNPFELITGATLAQNLLLKKGERLTLIFMDLNPTGLALIPRIKGFGFFGTFDSGIRAYDDSFSYTSLKALEILKNYPQGVYDGIHIYSNNAMHDITPIKALLDEYNLTHGTSLFVEGWWQQNGHFFSAMELEKKALFVVLMLIILMAALNIISSLLMVVMNRRKEIALLISLGTTKKEVRNIFLSLGLVIGCSGIVCGAILGLFINWLLKTFPIIHIPADVYGISTLPINLLTSDFLATIIGAFIIVFLSSLYPAYKASKINILEVLRNE
ncbi:hypothetical protein BKH43_01295 [Helicobacter sp. 13S00401-1]|uniref:ABC transporter permease n=1 Tax=Helicobacter sp. 13S00401-1 TaxID=1905758 RepID=UPI000BA6C0AE|nr:ABC transporter permease [Helicobacter sp. 13S00401-1]PAF51895.1 hypothetical protein BKH43_01295 [Helicobacter sp. 13S00401-1]